MNWKTKFAAGAIISGPARYPVYKFCIAFLFLALILITLPVLTANSEENANAVTVRIEIVKAETTTAKQYIGGGPGISGGGRIVWHENEEAPKPNHVFALLKVRLHNLTDVELKCSPEDFKAVTKKGAAIDIAFLLRMDNFGGLKNKWTYLFKGLSADIDPASYKDADLLLSIPRNDLKGMLLRYKKEPPVPVSF